MYNISGYHPFGYVDLFGCDTGYEIYGRSLVFQKKWNICDFEIHDRPPFFQKKRYYISEEDIIFQKKRYYDSEKNIVFQKKLRPLQRAKARGDLRLLLFQTDLLCKYDFQSL